MVQPSSPIQMKKAAATKMPARVKRRLCLRLIRSSPLGGSCAANLPRPKDQFCNLRFGQLLQLQHGGLRCFLVARALAVEPVSAVFYIEEENERHGGIARRRHQHAHGVALGFFIVAAVDQPLCFAVGRVERAHVAFLRCRLGSGRETGEESYREKNGKRTGAVWHPSLPGGWPRSWRVGS